MDQTTQAAWHERGTTGDEASDEGDGGDATGAEGRDGEPDSEERSRHGGKADVTELPERDGVFLFVHHGVSTAASISHG